jgi:hypothetical protein
MDYKNYSRLDLRKYIRKCLLKKNSNLSLSIIVLINRDRSLGMQELEIWDVSVI